MRRILFCNIAYMQYYDYENIKEVPKYGGKYVAETGDAYEKYNFHICEDGKVRGFVETKYTDGSASAQQPRKIRIENIDPICKNSDCIGGVTVIFCAHSDVLKKTVIVGWYKNATVLRNRLKYKGKQYNLECVAEDACLLTNNLRTFIVPRAVNGDFGFGQSNTWYAKDERAKEYIDFVLMYIDSHDEATISTDDSVPQILPEKYKESGIGKKVLVNKYERNLVARRKCLEIYGTSCMVCGFYSADVYGAEFDDKIEVHHIVPIHEINESYKVDPETDLIPVCPNCHMILHTKTKSGEYPSLAWLKSRVNRRRLKR